MKLQKIEPAASGADRVRVTGYLTYDDNHVAETIWFEVPRRVADALSTSGNPWLVACLPLAATLGEPLQLTAPVDGNLLANARRMLRIWHSWYPGLPGTKIDAPTVSATDMAYGSATGAFFSGGVDSFFTALRPRSCNGGSGPAIDDLITVGGFDVPIARREAIGRLHSRGVRVAEALGKESIAVTTNLRETRFREAPWGYLAHGCALAAVALLLERRYAAVYIAATAGYYDLHPWGSHVLTDPLCSTSTTAIIPDGASFARTEKIRRLVSSPTVLSELRVCWRSADGENCGRCTKCLRTMLVLELLGVLRSSDAFPTRHVDLRLVARLRCQWPWDYRELRDTAELAREANRPDVSRALNAAMRRSRLHENLHRLIDGRARKTPPRYFGGMPLPPELAGG